MLSLKNLVSLLMLLLLASGYSHASAADAATACFQNSGQDFKRILDCYTQAQAEQPLQYSLQSTTPLAGVERRRFELNSQRWDGHGFVSPTGWSHTVDIYIPQDALHRQALLIANNGTNIPKADKPARRASDITEEMALAIARQTKTIVISVSNLPNQYLTYSDDGLPRREDDSVAHSWKLFLQAPGERPFISAHIPMMQSLVKAMDLAQQELKPWQIERFIASGVSKRGWAVWMTALADNRVSAIAPFAIDILNTKAVLQHTYDAYGKSWPLAFNAYHQEGITQQLDTDNFAKLMQIEDPLTYMQGAASQRLDIPKYIVNASSDDFFPPDNSGFYFDQLPGQKSLRVAPNSSHNGIRQFVESSLIPVVNRWQQDSPLPSLTTSATTQGTGKTVSLQFSEAPVQVTQWTAVNPAARDFRDACGIRYLPRHVTPSTPLHAQVHMETPEQGWTATFVEATFADGLVVTTPVQIMPDRYPTAAPPETGPMCKTLPDLASR